MYKEKNIKFDHEEVVCGVVDRVGLSILKICLISAESCYLIIKNKTVLSGIYFVTLVCVVFANQIKSLKDWILKEISFYDPVNTHCYIEVTKFNLQVFHYSVAVRTTCVVSCFQLLGIKLI